MTSVPEQSAAEIVRRSKSNLAFAFACLPRQKREDMTIFYAFCRIVDDLADDPQLPREIKQENLDSWKMLLHSDRTPATTVEREILDLLQRYPIRRELLLEIIAGVEMDLHKRRYETYEELQQYCYRVASAVGLVSIEIFGYSSPQTPAYAVELGHALQITNILRDVGEDLRNDGRIYLPQEDLRRFGVSEPDLRAGTHSAKFIAVMDFEADRAEERYAKAQACLMPEDQPNLRASELMRAVYYALLKKMRHGRFRVLEQRYRLSALHKFILLARTLFFP